MPEALYGPRWNVPTKYKIVKDPLKLVCLSCLDTTGLVLT